MDDKLGDRVLYHPGIGRDPTEDLRRLGETIAASKADLFEQGGGVVGIDNGGVVGITPGILGNIIAKHVALKVPVNHGTEAQPAWKVTYPPYQPDEETVRALLGIGRRDWEDGGLLCRFLPKMPREPLKLNPQQQREVQTRLKTGEPQARIAAAYGVDVDEIRRQAR